jgi:formate--tetrahydrofolate ligase
MEDINLHFTGDFHAITSAHNLLAAMLDNHIYWGNALDIDTRRVFWRRVIDMNDRALRRIVSSLGGVANGFPREDGFDITVASEVMAIFCLARDLSDLERRLGDIVVAQTRARKNVTARDIGAAGAMTVLLKDALMPNLVQTIENNPVFVHGGPFANIAHGCNSLLATSSALKLADYVVTEAGFGADLGAEKFFNIKCRKSGLRPAAAVIVATVRALKMHGGVPRSELGAANANAVRAGASNLARHIANVRRFGVPAIVAINRFGEDTADEIEAVKFAAEAEGARAILCTHWLEGGAGAIDLANEVIGLSEPNQSAFRTLYPDDMSLWDKIRAVATTLYGAADITAEKPVLDRLEELQCDGFGCLPVCIAKTQYSFSTDATKLGAPSGHTVTVRDIRLSAGAGFVVVVTGDIMTMPGLPREPAANAIHLNADGLIEGLF